MKHQVLSYAADGLTMVSDLYAPDGAGPRPGVLVFPEAFGLGEHARTSARRLAELGYAALACDLHGEASLLSDLTQVMGVIGPLRGAPERIRARARGGLDALLGSGAADGGRIAAVGYCFGGTMSLELARSGADIRAAVGVHSGLGTAAPAQAATFKAKVLVCLGGDDPLVPVAERNAFEAEMRAAKVDWRMHLYGGVVHSFTNPEADKAGNPAALRYDAGADKRSWTEMLGLFDEVFG
jgi:dienelactone hydrolase